MGNNIKKQNIVLDKHVELYPPPSGNVNKHIYKIKRIFVPPLLTLCMLYLSCNETMNGKKNLNVGFDPHVDFALEDGKQCICKAENPGGMKKWAQWNSQRIRTSFTGTLK